MSDNNKKRKCSFGEPAAKKRRIESEEKDAEEISMVEPSQNAQKDEAKEKDIQKGNPKEENDSDDGDEEVVQKKGLIQKQEEKAMSSGVVKSQEAKPVPSAAVNVDVNVSSNISDPVPSSRAQEQVTGWEQSKEFKNDLFEYSVDGKTVTRQDDYEDDDFRVEEEDFSIAVGAEKISESDFREGKSFECGHLRFKTEEDEGVCVTVGVIEDNAETKEFWEKMELLDYESNQWFDHVEWGTVERLKSGEKTMNVYVVMDGTGRRLKCFKQEGTDFVEHARCVFHSSNGQVNENCVRPAYDAAKKYRVIAAITGNDSVELMQRTDDADDQIKELTQSNE